MADFWARFSAPLPAASCKPNNASALFGPGPSFTGLTAVDLAYARESRGPPKRKEPRKIRRSNSDLAVRRKSVERRKSRDLNKELSQSTNTQVANGGCRVPVFPNRLEKPPRPERSQSETSQDSTDQGLRYPLFIPVGAESQAQTKPRGEKQTVGQKISSPSVSKQSVSPGQRINRPRRSASFTYSRKTSVSEGNSTPRGTGNQPRKREVFRREKSDIVKPACGSAISKRSRSHSSAALNKNSSAVSPRSQLTASQRQGSASFGYRREKSDVQTRRAQKTPSPTDSPCQVIKGKDSSQSSSCRSISNCSDTSSSSAMSKIPSLKRAPVVAGKAPAQISRIPSLTKQHAPAEHARNPPKSKIPSISKADNKAKSQIPSATKINQDAPPTAKTSRIPSFSSPQGRPGSSKENQDPSVCETGSSGPRQEEASNQSISRIPSVSKKSRIPSLPRKDSGGIKLSETPSSRDDVEDGLQTNEEERITNGGTDPSKVKKTSVSRIPSLARPSAPEEDPKAKSNIPSPASAPAAKVPKMSGTQSPLAESPTGIPKPGRIQSPGMLPSSGIPTPSGQQPLGRQQSRTDDTKISSLPQPQSKLPQLSRKESAGNKPPSRLPSFSGATTSETAKERNVGVAKDASNASRLHLSTKANALVDKSPVLEDKKDTETSKTTPESEKGEETEYSPTHKRVANEAQKVEKLLREGHVVVEVPMEIEGENEAEREEEKPEDSTEKPELSIQDEKLISDVLESYAPDLADKENVPTDKIIGADKDTTKNPEGRLSFDDIYVHAFENEMAKTKLEVKPRAEVDIGETTKPEKEENEDKEGKKTEKEKTQTKKEAEPRALSDDNKKSTNAEVQALDTLGGYEQQSRRTRSRQRKMVSDTEESENEQNTSKKNIDKEKDGTSCSDAEKKTKSKSKNEKTKFVVESSLGKEFYEPRKTDSKESISVVPTVNKPEETSVVIENKNTQEHAPISQDVETNEAVEFEDIDLNSIEARREISRSVDELDEKTVQCMGCGRSGKCSIM